MVPGALVLPSDRVLKAHQRSHRAKQNTLVRSMDTCVESSSQSSMLSILSRRSSSDIHRRRRSQDRHHSSCKRNIPGYRLQQGLLASVLYTVAPILHVHLAPESRSSTCVSHQNIDRVCHPGEERRIRAVRGLNSGGLCWKEDDRFCCSH